VVRRGAAGGLGTVSFGGGVRDGGSVMEMSQIRDKGDRIGCLVYWSTKDNKYRRLASLVVLDLWEKTLFGPMKPIWAEYMEDEKMNILRRKI